MYIVLFSALSLRQKYSQMLVRDFRISLFLLHVVQDPQDGGAASFETSNYMSKDTA
jgi:hypothetical protein